MAKQVKNLTLHIRDADVLGTQLPPTDMEAINAELDAGCGGTYIRCDSTYTPQKLDLAEAVSQPAPETRRR